MKEVFFSPWTTTRAVDAIFGIKWSTPHVISLLVCLSPPKEDQCSLPWRLWSFCAANLILLKGMSPLAKGSNWPCRPCPLRPCASMLSKLPLSSTTFPCVVLREVSAHTHCGHRTDSTSDCHLDLTVLCPFLYRMAFKPGRPFPRQAKVVGIHGSAIDCTIELDMILPDCSGHARQGQALLFRLLSFFFFP